MVGEKLRRLLSNMRARRCADGGCGTQDEAHGMSRTGAFGSDPSSALQHPEEGSGGAPDDSDAMPFDVEEVDRLVHLTFDALLEREPDQDTVLAYREGFANGSTLRDLIDDVIASNEYADIRRRNRERRIAFKVSPEEAQDRPRFDEMRAAVQNLANRLNQKGCRVRFDAVSGPDQKMELEDRRRMRSLLATLSMLDQP